MYQIMHNLLANYLNEHLQLRHYISVTSDMTLTSGFSTEPQLLVTMHDLLTVFDCQQQVDVVFLDFSKAVDTVPHDRDGLLHKISNYRVKGQWVSDYLHF